MGEQVGSTFPIDPTAPGQIRMDIKKMALVRLLRMVFNNGTMTDSAMWNWQVEPVLGGEPYDLHPRSVGDDVYSGLEVIAWMAK